MKEDIKITMKAAMMFERLTGKNFTGISDDPEDIETLVYCAFVCSTGILMTRSSFDYMINSDEKLLQHITHQIENLNKFSMQFKKTDMFTENEQGGTNEQDVDFSLTDAMNTLIFDYGLDIDYVLNKMDMWEVECLYRGAQEHFRNQMEDKRLWAYISMLPHIDKKHAKSFTPSKMMEFPWEKERNRKEQERKLEIEKKKMDNIIGLNIDEIIANGKRGTDDSTGREGVSGRDDETLGNVGIGETGNSE